MKKGIYILVFMAVLSSFGKKEGTRDYFTDLDFTLKATETIVGGDETRIVEKGIDVKLVCGLFRNPIFDATGGHNFHIFPDRTFIIEEVGDVWESNWIAKGSWKIKKNKLSLKIKKLNKSDSVFMGLDRSVDIYGTATEWKVRYTTKGEYLGSIILLPDSDDERQEFEFNFLTQTKAYPDWETIKNEMIEQDA